MHKMHLCDVFLQVNDMVVTGDDTLVSYFSYTTLKVLLSQLKKFLHAHCNIDSHRTVVDGN